MIRLAVLGFMYDLSYFISIPLGAWLFSFGYVQVFGTSMALYVLSCIIGLARLWKFKEKKSKEYLTFKGKYFIPYFVWSMWVQLQISCHPRMWLIPFKPHSKGGQTRSMCTSSAWWWWCWSAWWLAWGRATVSSCTPRGCFSGKWKPIHTSIWSRQETPLLPA